MKQKDYKKLWLISLGWAIFLVFWINLAFIFALDQFYQASQKPFWLDERHGLEHSVRHAAFSDLFINGAKGQGSPAPLDYVFLKILDNLKGPLNSFGFTAEVYFRFVSIFSTLFAALFVLIYFSIHISRQASKVPTKIVQLILLGFVPIAFFFSRYVYYYAAEMRPYALWNALYFLALALSLLKDRYLWAWITFLVLLAFTATASIYQIAMLAMAYFTVEFIQNRSFVRDSINTIKVFIVPIVIALFYCFKVTQWAEPFSKDEWSDYFHLWLHKMPIVPMMLVGIVLCWIKKENRKYTIAPLGFLLLYLLGPLTFWLTKMKGFFYTDRQYVYYDLTNPVFLLTVLCVLPAYSDIIKKKLYYFSILGVVILIGLSVTFKSKVNKKISKAVSRTVFLYKNPDVIRSGH